MSDHPVIVARKNPAPQPGDVPALRARVDILAAPETASAGATIALGARVTNTGSSAWTVASDGRSGSARLGIQLLDADRRLVDRDYYRQSLPAPLRAGEHCELRVSCPAPSSPGTYWLKADVVVEGVSWLEGKGGQTGVHQIRVE